MIQWYNETKLWNTMLYIMHNMYIYIHCIGTVGLTYYVNPTVPMQCILYFVFLFFSSLLVYNHLKWVPLPFYKVQSLYQVRQWRFRFESNIDIPLGRQPALHSEHEIRWAGLMLDRRWRRCSSIKPAYSKCLVLMTERCHATRPWSWWR